MTGGVNQKSKMERIKSIEYNWTEESSSAAIVGHNNVILIEEFLAPKWGNLTSYLVHLKDKSSFRVFNPNLVEYFPYEGW